MKANHILILYFDNGNNQWLPAACMPKLLEVMKADIQWYYAVNAQTNSMSAVNLHKVTHIVSQCITCVRPVELCQCER